MARFHLAMYYDQSSGAVPDDLDQIMAEVNELNHEMKDANVWVMAAGFEAAPEAHVVTADASGADTADGPYLPTQEQAGGFWIIETRSMGDALVWAERASRIIRLPIEVRAITM